MLAKAGDLAAILTNLEPRDVLFIDEIHRLNPAIEEMLRREAAGTPQSPAGAPQRKSRAK